MSEHAVLALFSLCMSLVIGVAVGLYKHVGECRTVHAKLARIMERMGIEDL